MARVGMIGAGSWGIALAWLLNNNGHDVTVWSALGDEIDMLEKEREHKDKLPGVKLSDKMSFTTRVKNEISGIYDNISASKSELSAILRNSYNKDYTGVATRVFPQVGVEWKYQFIRNAPECWQIRYGWADTNSIQQKTSFCKWCFEQHLL